MHDVVNLTRSNGFKKFYATNATDASFPSKIATTTQPANDGVYDFTANGISPNGLLIPSAIVVIPYGVGSDNNTQKIRIIGWRLIGTLWVPTPLCQFTCTLSAAVGVAGATVVATERFADTLTADSMNPSGGVEAVSPTGDLVAHFVVDIKGCPIIEATFDRNSSATSCNALWAAV